jgi:hypothetical protein
MTMVMMMTCCICSGSRTEQTLARPGYPGSSLFRSNKSDLSKHSTRRLGDRPVSPILVPFCPPRRDLHPSLSLLSIVDNLIDRPISLSLSLSCWWLVGGRCWKTFLECLTEPSSSKPGTNSKQCGEPKTPCG